MFSWVSQSVSEYFWPPKTPVPVKAQTTPEVPKQLGTGEAKTEGPAKLGETGGNTVSLPQNAMERVKQKLLGYAEELEARKENFKALREQALFFERPETNPKPPVQTLQSQMTPAKAAKDLEGKLHNLEVQAEPLINELLKDIPQLQDVRSVIKLCKDVNRLIEHLDLGLVQIKGFAQDARDKKTLLRNLLTWALAWKGVQIGRLYPASTDERNDDKLYEAMAPHLSEFDEWLSDVKVRLQRAEDAVSKCVAQLKQQAELEAKQDAGAKQVAGNSATLVSKAMAFTPVGVSDSAAANATATGVSVDGPQASQTSNATAQRAQSPATEQQLDMGGLELGSEHIPQPPPISPRRLGGAAV